MLPYIAMSEIYQENRDVALITFSNNGVYFSVILDQNLTNGNFFNSYFQHRVCNHINKLLVFIMWKSMLYVALWKDPLPTPRFCVTAFISLIEHIGSLNYADLPNVDTFHYITLKRITFVNTIIDLIRKVFKY